MNGALDRWCAGTMRALGALRSLWIDVWTTLVFVVAWLVVDLVNPAFAASNAMMLMTLTLFGWLVGSRVGALRLWPGTVLVPGYTRSLFVVCLGATCLAVALAALWSWSLGNSIPAVGPGLFLGVAVTWAAIRLPFHVYWPIALPLTFVLATALDLSRPWLQLLSLLGVGLIAPGIKRSLDLPTTRSGHPKQQFAMTLTLVRDLQTGVAFMVGTLAVVVPLWVMFPSMGERLFAGLWFCSLGVAILSWWMDAAHVQLAHDWTLALAKDRRHLGRRAAARAVWISVPWVVVGTGWSILHAFTKAPNEATFFADVLAVQTVAILCIALLFRLSRGCPPALPHRLLVGILMLGSGAAATTALAHIDYTTWGYGALLIALAGSVVVAVLAGGRAMVNSEVLADAPGAGGLGVQGAK